MIVIIILKFISIIVRIIIKMSDTTEPNAKHVIKNNKSSKNKISEM